MAEKRFRWVCPGCGDGRLASSRPKRTATIRYCLPCSDRTGVLVERTCPALERKRADKEHARSEKAKRAREARRRLKAAMAERNAARRAERTTAMLEAVGDLDAELARLWPIACSLTVREDRDPRCPPALSHRIGRAKHGAVTGHAWYHDHRITLTVPNDADTAGAYGTLAHEVAHFMVADREVHGPAFWTFLVALVEQAYDATADLCKQTTSWGRQLVVEQAIREARARKGL